MNLTAFAIFALTFENVAFTFVLGGVAPAIGIFFVNLPFLVIAWRHHA